MQVKLDITDGSQKNGEECCSHIARKLSLKNNTGQVGEECGKPGCQRRLKRRGTGPSGRALKNIASIGMGITNYTQWCELKLKHFQESFKTKYAHCSSDNSPSCYRLKFDDNAFTLFYSYFYFLSIAATEGRSEEADVAKPFNGQRPVQTAELRLFR